MADKLKKTTKGYTNGNLVFEVNTAEKTAKVKDFNPKKDITEIPTEVIVDNETLTVTAIEKMALCKCKKLTTLVVPETVTEIGDLAFAHSSIQSIVIGDNVKHLGLWFEQCENLKSVTLGAGIETATELNIFRRVDFCSTPAVREIIVKSPTPIPNIKGAFYGILNDQIARQLCKVYVPKGSLAAYQSAEGWKDLRLLGQE